MKIIIAQQMAQHTTESNIMVMVSIANNYQLFDLSHSPTTSVAKASRGLEQSKWTKNLEIKTVLLSSEEL